MEERRGAYTNLVRKPKEKGHFEYLGVDGSILTCIFKKYNGGG
jgi:hypothetical protein